MSEGGRWVQDCFLCLCLGLDDQILLLWRNRSSRSNVDRRIDQKETEQIVRFPDVVGFAKLTGWFLNNGTKAQFTSLNIGTFQTTTSRCHNSFSQSPFHMPYTTVIIGRQGRSIFVCSLLVLFGFEFHGCNRNVGIVGGRKLVAS